MFAWFSSIIHFQPQLLLFYSVLSEKAMPGESWHKSFTDNTQSHKKIHMGSPLLFPSIFSLLSSLSILTVNSFLLSFSIPFQIIALSFQSHLSNSQPWEPPFV